MPLADSDGVAIHYEVGGDGGSTADAPVVLLADAGYGAWQWSWQFPALAGPFEVLIPSTRGTGDSDAPGSYAVAEMAADVDAVLADRGARKAHLVGAGLGGMVALRYALDFSRARTLTLLGTSPGGPRATAVPDDVRDRLLASPDDPDSLRRSLDPVAGEELLETDDLVDRIVAWRREEDADPAAQRGHLDAMADFDVGDSLYEITVPALVCHGEDDRVVPVENGRLLADGLPKGEFRRFPGEHLFYVERSKAVNDAVVGFLTDHADD
ncbi:MULTISPECIES: alpha/beta fold hydrolase [Halorussus]|uniref:alpha/beta fold hydrolase n=1 Tax=Halorussus TaxID=1070314 RepID=UPI000E2170C8|nr:MULTISPECIES: alpha/beta hydrolase [Halorussus]NHN60395.1 alpha/beta hydrolase [Halorussus sp. JP-T4]